MEKYEKYKMCDICGNYIVDGEYYYHTENGNDFCCDCFTEEVMHEEGIESWNDIKAILNEE